MTQEDKQLLLKDLSGRLPYGVKVKYYSMEYPYGSKPVILTPYLLWDRWENINEMRPYLRPLSSMTKEEGKEWEQLLNYNLSDENEMMVTVFVEDTPDYIDWFNEHHFDYRGLIEKSLALEAPEDMYK